ncbi:MAG: hypothetical protein E6Q84_01370 [Thiothrix sp.]|nr:MAG: hypothetical protein E6Q84_01370 [Thiothrix sp.]
MLIRRIKTSYFAKNVAILFSGTAISQAIPIAVSPILTRIYTPDEFGLLAIYIACITVLGVIATARFELAITLPDNHIDAANLVILTLKICTFISLLLFIPIALFGSDIAANLGHERLTPWLYFLPLSVIATSAFSTVQLWYNRLSQYKIIAMSRVQQSLLTASSQIGFGLSQLSGGLLIGSIFANLVFTSWVMQQLWQTQKTLFKSVNSQSQLRLAQRYSSHPKYIAPSQLIGVTAQQIPLLIISSVYSLTVAGFFSLAFRLVSLPTALVASAIGDVYRQKISEEYNQNGEFRATFLKTLTATASLALLPSIMLYAAAPTLFALLFGESWRIAGEYAQILIISAYVQFIFTPIDKGALIVGANRYIFIWHCARLASLTILFFYATYQHPSIELILYLFALINITLYVVDGIVEYRLSGKQY